MGNTSIATNATNALVNVFVSWINAIDPNTIIIPFRQEVTATFLYEGAGYDKTDFGWMYSSGGATGTKFELYTNVNDNNGNGVLDSNETDVNGDGVINAKDNTVILGTFDAGTEIVFYLNVDNEGRTYYTKKDWNPDTWNGDCSGNNISKTYRLGQPMSEGGCRLDKGWMDQPALDRLKDIFDLDFDLGDTATLIITRYEKYDHVIVGVPGDKPNEWILGWEDLGGGGDTDHNDLVFRIQRETGGIAEVNSDKAMTPTDPDAYFTSITFEIFDFIECEGKNDIEYFLSIDNGSNWIEITNWDQVYEYDNSSVSKDLIGSEISATWEPGSPQYTYRKVRVDFAAINQSGREFIWKARLLSQDESCSPGIADVLIDANVAKESTYSRATPSVMANMMYSGSFDTANATWSDDTPRGHLEAIRIYDPYTPGSTPDAERHIVFWEAGEKLKSINVGNRKIMCPSITATTINGEVLGIGDGATNIYTGTLAKFPISATTLKISDTNENFYDIHIDTLDGSLGGTGFINRHTGEYSITFNSPPDNGINITASYIYYSTGDLIQNFNTANVNISSTVLGLDATYINGTPSGRFKYDFNSDGLFNGMSYGGSLIDDKTDRNWLINWVRGFSDGSATKKDWLLGAVDHSVPALLTAPGKPLWYFGTDINDNEREKYDAFMLENRDRKAVLFVGARDGMLHAFDGGRYLMEDSKITSFTEHRGHFRWKVMGNPVSPIVCTNNGSWVSQCPPKGAIIIPAEILVDQMFGTSDYYVVEVGDESLVSGSQISVGPSSGVMIAPDYGTGEELWAFIPANLIPRLKNNALDDDDQAFVDASPAIADVYIDSTDDGTENPEWKSVLIAAEGNGGDTIYCLDVTDPINPVFLWEYGHPDLFRSRSSPAIAQIGRITSGGDAKWVAFFVSGKTYSNVHPSIYMIDIETGMLTSGNKIELDCMGDAGKGGIPSGQPAIVDSDNNGYIDRVYVGTSKGYMYKVNIPDDPRSNYYVDGDTSKGIDAGITHCIINSDFDNDNDGIDDVSDIEKYQAIYGCPAVVVDNEIDDNDGSINYRIRIFYGTSDSPYIDEGINTSTTKYHFYAYIDFAGKGVCNNFEDTIDTTNDCSTGNCAELCSGDESKCDCSKLDWQYTLPEGHRVYASAFAAAGKVYFGTSTAETEDPCEGFSDPDANRGKTFVLNTDSNIPTNIIDTGNITDTPLVDDKHLYLRSPGGIKYFGDNTYNTEVIQGIFSSIAIKSWREIRE